MVICSTKPEASDNKCFFFSNFDMYAAEEQGLQPFLADSFTIGPFDVVKVEARQHFFVLAVGSLDLEDSERNALLVYGTHNDAVHKFLSVGPIETKGGRGKSILDLDSFVLD